MNSIPDEWFDVSMEEDAVVAIRVKDGIFIGNHAAASDRDLLVLNKITHIVNCAGKEIPDYFATDPDCEFSYLSFPWDDIGLGGSMSVSTPVLFDDRNENLSRSAAFIDNALEKGECVMVHSRLGVSRAPALLAGYFVVKYGWRPSTTLLFLHCVHPGIAIQPPFLLQIHQLSLKFPVEIDIFDEDVDETPFCLDNDQWVLRNTLLNCLPHYEQEKNRLYQSCKKHVDIGVETTMTENNSAGHSGAKKASAQKGEKKGQAGLLITEGSTEGSTQRKDDERTKNREKSGNKRTRGSATALPQGTEKMSPSQALPPQTRKKKVEKKGDVNRTASTKSTTARRIDKEGVLPNSKNTPSITMGIGKETISPLLPVDGNKSSTSLTPSVNRRIRFVDTKKGTKVDATNSSPVVFPAKHEQNIETAEPSTVYSRCSLPSSSQLSSSAGSSSPPLQSSLFTELEKFTGGKGIAALMRLGIQTNVPLNEESMRERKEENTGDGDVSSAGKSGKTHAPLPLSSSSTHSVTCIREEKRNDDSGAGYTSSITHSASPKDSFFRSNSILRRRCTSPCQHRLTSDTESSSTENRRLAKLPASLHSTPDTTIPSSTTVLPHGAVSPSISTPSPLLRSSMDRHGENIHDSHCDVTNITLKRQNVAEEHVDPYRRSGGLPPPLPSLSPDRNFTDANLAHIESEENLATDDSEEGVDGVSSATASSLLLFQRPSTHVLKEVKKNNIEKAPETVSSTSKLPLPSAPTAIILSETQDTIPIPPPSQDHQATVISLASSFESTSPTASNDFIATSNALPNSSTGLATSSYRNGDETSSREESPTPTRTDVGSTGHSLQRRSGMRTSHDAVSPIQTSGITVAPGHEHLRLHSHAAGTHSPLTNSFTTSPLNASASRSPYQNSAFPMRDVETAYPSSEGNSTGEVGVAQEEAVDAKHGRLTRVETTTMPSIPLLPLESIELTSLPLPGAQSSGVSAPLPRSAKDLQRAGLVKPSPRPTSSSTDTNQKKKKIMKAASQSSVPASPVSLLSATPLPHSPDKEGTSVGSLSTPRQSKRISPRPPLTMERPKRITIYSKLAFPEPFRGGSPRPTCGTKLLGKPRMDTSGAGKLSGSAAPIAPVLGVQSTDLKPTRTASGRLQIRSSSSSRRGRVVAGNGGSGTEENEKNAAQRAPHSLYVSLSSLTSPQLVKSSPLIFTEGAKMYGSPMAQRNLTFLNDPLYRSNERNSEDGNLSTSLTSQSFQSPRDSGRIKDSFSSVGGRSMPSSKEMRMRKGSPSMTSLSDGTRTVIPPPPIKLFGSRSALAPPQMRQGPLLTTIGTPRRGISSHSSSSRMSARSRSRSFSPKSSLSGTSIASDCEDITSSSSSAMGAVRSRRETSSVREGKYRGSSRRKIVPPNPSLSSVGQSTTSLFLSTTTSARVSPQEVVKKFRITTDRKNQEKESITPLQTVTTSAEGKKEVADSVVTHDQFVDPSVEVGRYDQMKNSKPSLSQNNKSSTTSKKVPKKPSILKNINSLNGRK